MTLSGSRGSTIPLSIMSFLPPVPPAGGLGGLAEDSFQLRERELAEKAARHAQLHPEGSSTGSPRRIRRLLHRLRSRVKALG
jgi:hypothetical protein